MAQQQVQTYRGTLYRASKHRISLGQRAARSSASQESAEPVRENQRREPGGF